MCIDVRAHTWKVEVGCRLSKLAPPPSGYSRTTLFSFSCGVSPVVQSTVGQPGHKRCVLIGLSQRIDREIAHHLWPSSSEQLLFHAQEQVHVLRHERQLNLVLATSEATQSLSEQNPVRQTQTIRPRS